MVAKHCCAQVSPPSPPAAAGSATAEAAIARSTDGGLALQLLSSPPSSEAVSFSLVAETRSAEGAGSPEAAHPADIAIGIKSLAKRSLPKKPVGNADAVGVTSVLDFILGTFARKD
jgi:hypothetical protein